MFRFATPEMLYLLAIIPLIVVVYIVIVKARKRRLESFGEIETIIQLMPDASPGRLRTKFGIYIISLILIIIALARPQLGAKLKEVSKEGIEIMIAVDVSNSMLAQDFEPNRLEKTKYAITRLLDELKNDKIGLIVFAGDAYVQLPITSDYTAARNFANHISSNMISKQGTALGSAISLATKSFSSDSEGSRVLILISDGENHEDDAMSAAKSAEESGIVIHAIGIGTPEGAPIEINGEFIKDENGEMVVSKLNEKMLEDVALSTGGAYIRSSNKSLGLQEIIDLVNKTEKKRFKSVQFEAYSEKYQIFIVIAIILLLIEVSILNRKNRVLARFNIFTKKR